MCGDFDAAMPENEKVRLTAIDLYSYMFYDHWHKIGAIQLCNFIISFEFNAPYDPLVRYL